MAFSNASLISKMLFWWIYAAAYIHQNNILDIREALEKAIYHIERNGNAKIIFTDVSIQLTRLIHRDRSRSISMN